ncbi:MAG: hypothetical protein FWD47_14600 [Treponema sp.]|nr:hypothetical protein [Treponema sp.]
MLSDKERYDYLNKTHDFLFSQFNLWVVFFIVINGGLSYAYVNSDLRYFDKILILLLGYFATLFFYCTSTGIYFFINHYINHIIYLEEKNIPNIHDRLLYRVHDKRYSFTTKSRNYFNPIQPVYTSSVKIVILFSYLLTYAWGILLASNVCERMEISLWYGIILIIIAVFIVNIIFLKFVEFYLSGSLNEDTSVNLGSEDIPLADCYPTNV